VRDQVSKEHKSHKFENDLGNTRVPVKGEVSEQFRILHNEELRDFFRSHKVCCCYRLACNLGWRKKKCTENFGSETSGKEVS
jgi:hypothetical protein